MKSLTLLIIASSSLLIAACAGNDESYKKRVNCTAIVTIKTFPAQNVLINIHQERQDRFGRKYYKVKKGLGFKVQGEITHKDFKELRCG